MTGPTRTSPVRRRTVLALLLALLTVAPIVGSLVEFFGAEAWSQPVELASGAEVEGDPASDDEVEARTDAGGREATVVFSRTPAGWIDEAPEGDRVREASPTGPVDAELRLAAGPVERAGPGNVSPAFPLDVRLSVDADDDVDRAWLRLDGQRWAPLELAGTEGDRRVHLARLAPHTLPAGQTTHVDVLFERRPTPATTHVLQGPGWDVHADARGPPAPELTDENGTVAIDGQAHRWQAQQRSADGGWQAAPVTDGTIEPTLAAAHELRARGIDRVGNAGPWSPPHPLENGTEPAPRPAEPFRVLAPEPGDEVEGEVLVDWRPAKAVGFVEVEARSSTHEDRHVGHAAEPPIRWRTGFVPDGDWTLHVRAQTEDGWSSRLVPVTVDNLETVELADDDEGQGSQPASEIVPRTRSPLSAVLASGAGALALTSLVTRAWKRRPK